MCSDWSSPVSSKEKIISPYILSYYLSATVRRRKASEFFRIDAKKLDSYVWRRLTSSVIKSRWSKKPLFHTDLIVRVNAHDSALCLRISSTMLKFFLNRVFWVDVATEGMRRECPPSRKSELENTLVCKIIFETKLRKKSDISWQIIGVLKRFSFTCFF